MSTHGFKFLKDAPIGKDTEGFFDFYHKSVAPALRSIIENDTCVHTVGLFGRWGTGKSTIIKLLKDDGITDAKIVEFDCWKYEKDSLRRQLLLQIAKDLGISRKKVEKLEKDLYFSVSESLDEKVTVSWGHLKKVGLISLAFLIPIGFINWQLFPDLLTQWKLWAGTTLSLVLSIGLLAEKFLGDDLKKIIMISPITSSRAQLNSPEQFEHSFVEILKQANSDSKKIVIVIDNLDRVDSKVATEILATLKTFLEIREENLGGKKVIFLVPCDFDAIKRAAPSAELADEYLRKIFNVVVWTPEYMDTDIRTFIKDQLKQTGDIKTLLEDEDVYLVIESAFANSPREIKQFINNLISSLVVAFNTEVKEIVEKNIAYMAKVLVLMHKYPEAFQNLKNSWHAPEEVVSTYKTVVVDPGKEPRREEFENFMLKTSRITVDDAEPFIYLKKPVVSGQLNDAEAIRLAIIEGDETSAKTHVGAETNKGALLDFIISILNKYQNQTLEIITRIFKTQLAVLCELKITGKGYVNTVGNLLDGKVWPSFQELPTDTIFEFILSDSQLDGKLRSNILERYVVALDSTEEFKNFQKVETLKTIFRNLIKHQSFLNNDQILNTTQAIEQMYSSREDVMGLFVEAENREKFVTRKALEQIVQTSTIQNFAIRKDLITGFKELISKHKLFLALYQKFGELLVQHNQKVPGFGDEKEQYLQQVLSLVQEFEESLNQVTPANGIEFVRGLIQTFNNISPWNNRLTVMNILVYLEDIVEDGVKNEIKQLLIQFIQNADPDAVQKYFEFWNIEYVQSLISETLPQLQQRIITQHKFAKVIYPFAKDETRLKILKYMVTHNAVEAIDFISSLTVKDYKRADFARLLLEKAASLGMPDRQKIYEFIADKISKNDDVALKDLAADQIKELLTQDNESHAGVGFDFFSKADFLSEEKKREIVKAILEFIRQPGKIVTQQHKNLLKAVSAFFDNLQETPQKDYIYCLFGLIKDGQDADVIQMAISNLNQVRPLFKDYQKDYNDIAEALGSWRTDNTKALVVDGLLQMKRMGRIGTEEAKYWENLEALKPHTDQ